MHLGQERKNKHSTAGKGSFCRDGFQERLVPAPRGKGEVGNSGGRAACGGTSAVTGAPPRRVAFSFCAHTRGVSILLPAVSFERVS